MKRALILAMILTASSCVFAQEGGNAVFFQSQAAGPVTTVGVGMFGKPPGAPVQGAPYSATITNENIQTLEDGTHITQTTTGNIARDSQGRTRQDASLPSIGNLSAADAPHLVFIQDPVAQTAYTLNLTDKTAQKMPALPPESQHFRPDARRKGLKVNSRSALRVPYPQATRRRFRRRESCCKELSSPATRARSTRRTSALKPWKASR